MKEMINWILPKLKSFALQDIIKVKRQITDRKKIFATHVSHKGLVYSYPEYTNDSNKSFRKRQISQLINGQNTWWTNTLEREYPSSQI